MACLSAAFLLPVAPAAAQGDPAMGKARYAVCQACHGVNGEGNKALNAPNLAGQDPLYLARQIRNYQRDVRGYDPQDIFGLQMKAMAKTLPDDKAVLDAVAYIATLPAPKAQPASVQGNATLGKELFNVCAQCHGNRGEGRQQMNAPRIAGLPDWYVLRQLKGFLQKTRGAHPQDPYGVQMRPMVRAILRDPADENPLLDVTAFLATLD
jgi:cytochrome c oxidase subunit 2